MSMQRLMLAKYDNFVTKRRHADEAWPAAADCSGVLHCNNTVKAGLRRLVGGEGFEPPTLSV